MLTQPTSMNSNLVVQEQLTNFVQNIAINVSADILSFFGPIIDGIDIEIRDAVELFREKKEKLLFILETEGGYIETVQRIVDIIRTHYKEVDFIIPNFAMSAGTVLVMSGDAIYMDYFSVLGPIDPQVSKLGTTGLIPAIGYLEKYDQLIEKANKGILNQAELQYLITKFDPAELHKYEHARELSISLLEEWLTKYKFKNWIKTETHQFEVTQQMRKQRAKEIAEKLSDTKLWHSHGRGISMNVLKNILNLRIEDFGKNNDLSNNIKLYYRLLKDYMLKLNVSAIIHSEKELKAIIK